MNIDTVFLRRCLDTLERALAELKRSDPTDIAYDIYRAACVKEFEIVLEQGGKLLKKRLAAMEVGRVNLRELAKVLLEFDTNALLHGVFLAKKELAGGRLRLPRSLSAFVEADGARRAVSGGVKNDRIAPAPTSLKQIGLEVSAAEGYGNVPFHRTEYTAERITAYFNLDLAQIRAYGLEENAERFLVTLALWKVRRFLETGLRLRTACDLDMPGDLEVTRPGGFLVPETRELEDDLPGLIEACALEGLFADPPVTELTFQKKGK